MVARQRRALPPLRAEVAPLNLSHELRLLVRDKQVPWLLGFLVAIMCVSFWSGVNERADIQRKFAEAQGVVREQTEQLTKNLEAKERGEGKDIRPDPTLPAAFAHATNPYVLKEDSRLALTAVGESDVRPSLLRLGNPDDPTWVQDEILSPLALASGRFDLVFVTVVLLPLVVIALMFRLFASERETGTLPLLASGDTPVWALLAGRATLRFIAMSVVVSVLFWCGVLVTMRPVPISLGLVWTVFVMAYMGFWFLLCYLICGWRRSSDSNIVVLISAWVALVILAPTVSNAYLSRGSESVSRLNLVLEYRAILEHKEATAPLVESLHLRLGIQDLSPDDSQSKFFALREFAQTSIKGDLDRKRDQAMVREESLRQFSRWNPPIALTSLLVSLAGRDARSFRQFEEYIASEHQRRGDKFLKARLVGQRMTSADLGTATDLGPQQSPSTPGLGQGYPLYGWCAILLTLSFCVFKRNR